MVRNPPKQRNLKTPLLAVGVLAAFLLAGFAPLAAAEREHPDKPDRDRPHRAAEAAMKRGKGFTFELNGTAVTKDNVTYTILIKGEGKARAKAGDDNLTKIHGFARLHVQLLDADGTIVKEGRLRAKIGAMETAEGDYDWRLVAVGKKPRWMPNLVLRGDGQVAPEGGIELSGHGKGVVKLPEDDHRTVLRIDVSGLLTRAASATADEPSPSPSPSASPSAT